MKVIIAGSRYFEADKIYETVVEAVMLSGFEITEVVSGAARGVDEAGELYAEANQLKCTKFEADWEQYKRAAGPIRNNLMAEYADALIAIPDNRAYSGTKNMIERMRVLGKPVYILEIDDDTI